MSVCSICSHLVPKVRQEVSQSGNCAAAHSSSRLYCNLSIFPSLINALLLQSKWDISKTWDGTCTPVFGHLFTKCPLCNTPLSLQTCVAPISGRSGPECVLNLFIPATQHCLLSNSPHWESLQASAKKLITLFFKSPPVHLPPHSIFLSTTHMLWILDTRSHLYHYKPLLHHNTWMAGLVTMIIMQDSCPTYYCDVLVQHLDGKSRM